MATENATSITELDPTRPVNASEPIGEIGDYHKMVKQVLLNTFIDQVGDEWDDAGQLAVGPRKLTEVKDLLQAYGLLVNSTNGVNVEISLNIGGVEAAEIVADAANTVLRSRTEGADVQLIGTTTGGGQRTGLIVFPDGDGGSFTNAAVVLYSSSGADALRVLSDGTGVTIVGIASCSVETTGQPANTLARKDYVDAAIANLQSQINAL